MNTRLKAVIAINLVVLTYLNLFTDDVTKLRFVFWLLAVNAYPLGLELRDKVYKPFFGPLLRRFAQRRCADIFGKF
jgi:hypothetical protein